MGHSIGSHQRRWNVISTPPPHSIFHHGFEDEADNFATTLPSDGRVQADMRTHLIHRPARSIHSHRSWGSQCPSIGLDAARFSRCCCGLFSGPAELGAVNPYTVHDHGQPPGQGHDRLFIPQRLAICIAQALSQDHFLDRNML